MIYLHNYSNFLNLLYSINLSDYYVFYYYYVLTNYFDQLINGFKNLDYLLMEIICWALDFYSFLNDFHLLNL